MRARFVQPWKAISLTLGSIGTVINLSVSGCLLLGALVGFIYAIYPDRNSPPGQVFQNLVALAIILILLFAYVITPTVLTLVAFVSHRYRLATIFSLLAFLPAISFLGLDLYFVNLNRGEPEPSSNTDIKLIDHVHQSQTFTIGLPNKWEIKDSPSTATATLPISAYSVSASFWRDSGVTNNEDLHSYIKSRFKETVNLKSPSIERGADSFIVTRINNSTIPKNEAYHFRYYGNSIVGEVLVTAPTDNTHFDTRKFLSDVLSTLKVDDEKLKTTFK